MSIIVEPFADAGKLDGITVRVACVWDNERQIGSIFDLGGGYYGAGFVTRTGEQECIVLDSYYNAIMRVAEESWIRRRTLN